MNLKQAQQVFLDYASAFDQQNEKVRLKIAHTLRVMRHTQGIAQSLHRTKEEQELAAMIGLLHDIGRFEQLKRYDTFLDAKSVNHAALSVAILKEQDFLRQFVKEKTFDDVIYTAIAYHNAYEVPAQLDEHTALFAHILRDGDKTDIFYVNVQEQKEVLYLCDHETLCADTLSPAVKQAFLRQESIRHEDRKTHLDILVSHLALLFDMKFAYGIEVFVKENYLPRMLEGYTFVHPKTRQDMEEIKACMQAYIQMRLAKQTSSV